MRKLAALLLPALLLALPDTALAKSDKTLEYSYEAVWSSAIRLIRADRGYTIKDKDKENGFILFIFPGAGSVKECPASLEVLSVVGEDKQKRIKVQLSIQHQPSYIEVHFLDKLEEKIREEQGSPQAPVPVKKPKEEKKKDKAPEEREPEF